MIHPAASTTNLESRKAKSMAWPISLSQLRTEMVQTDRAQYDSGQIPENKQPLDARFFWLPEEQLAAYEAEREQSELGRIFKVANGMHDEIDAVVVLGIGGSYMGARAMMEACCDPYHNELTRGNRGSKPRMYFEGNNVDNDASAALLHRLAQGGYGDSPAEKRTAIVVISKSGGTMETAVAFRQFLVCFGNNAARRRPRNSLDVW